MAKYRKITSIIIFSIFVLSSSFAFSEEEFTITTYYPSPYGVYKNLRIYPNDDSTPGGACANNGEMYFDNSEQNLYICSGNVWKLVPGRDSIPSGMIAMFTASCPTGWTRFTALDDKFPKGAGSYGVTGGSATHTHTTAVPCTTQGVSIYPTLMMSIQTGCGSSSVSISNNEPPYVSVVWCKKD
jgi:hypothetical protein